MAVQVTISRAVTNTNTFPNNLLKLVALRMNKLSSYEKLSDCFYHPKRPAKSHVFQLVSCSPRDISRTRHTTVNHGLLPDWAERL